MKSQKLKPTRIKSTPAAKHPPLILPGFTPLVESSDDGSLLSRLRETSLVLPWDECLRHTLVTGKTGSGKTQRFMLRAMFAAIRNTGMSMVILDAQGSEEERIINYARHVRGADTRIIRLNWIDPEFSTHYWNCLDSVSRKSEVYDIASSITGAMGELAPGDGLYFRQQATLLLAALFQALGVVGKATLGEARRILDGGSRAMSELAGQAKIPELERFASEMEAGNRNTETSVAEASNHLIALLDERVCQTTGANELDFQMLADEPTILILSLDEEAANRLRPLTNVFMHRLMAWIISTGRAQGGPLPRPLGIFIDEFASAVGRLPEFECRAHTLRKRNAAIFAAIQSTTQIAEKYGQAAQSVLAAFNHRIFVPPVADLDAREASSFTGIMATDAISTSATGAALNISPLHRPLLMPQEIASPERDQKLGPRLTFLMADTPPFQAWLKAAFEVEDERPWVATSGTLPLRRRAVRKTRPESPPASPPDRTISARTGITNTAGWSNRKIEDLLATTKANIGWKDTAGSARKWWESFENENSKRKGLVLHLAEELQNRSATISEFFLSYVYSNANGIMANLHYLDYNRLKKEEEKAEQATGTRAPMFPAEAETEPVDDWFDDEPPPGDEEPEDRDDEDEAYHTELNQLLADLMESCESGKPEADTDPDDS